MTTPRIYLACLWGAIALFALYNGIARGSAVAWWLLAALVPPLIVFVWWMVDRAALERRIKRLEAQSEIGDERRVDAHTDLTKVEHKLQEIETRVAQVEDNEAGATRSGVSRGEQFSGHSRSSVAGGISINPK
jgi:type VI protein secretion system component VasK